MKKSDKFRENALLVVLGVVLFWGLFNYDKLLKLIGGGLKILSPFIIGIVLALILNVPMSAIERNMFRPDKNNRYRKTAQKIKRPVSIVLTLLIFFGAVALVLWLVIPEMVETVAGLSQDLPEFLRNIWHKMQDSPTVSRWLEQSNISKDEVAKKAQELLKDGALILKTLTSTVNAASDFITAIVDFFIGIFFAIYMLMQKEKLKNQLYRITNAVFPKKIADLLCHVGNLSKQTFSKFLSGQCIEAIILGTLCCIGMSILRFPNAVTIGILVAVTAFIPIVGAFIGVAVGALLIMVTDFMQAVWFVVFMLVLQQIEGNFIYPKVVGTSVGLPSLWVLFAITAGGAVGGIVGMFVSVPICSVLYCLVKEGVEYLEKRRKNADSSEEQSEMIPAGEGVSLVRRRKHSAK